MISKNTLFVILYVGLSCCFSSQAKYATVDSVIKGVAAVGSELITDRDINERLKLLMVFSSKKLDNTALSLLKKHVKEALIVEKLKVLYAKKFNNSPDKEYVDQQQVLDNFASIAEANGVSSKEFRKKLEENGVDIKTFLDQIYAKLTWNAYIYAKFGNQIVISDNAVNAKYTTINKMLRNKAYNIERFFLPFSNDKDKKVAILSVQDIAKLLDAGIDFQSITRQFSSRNDAIIGGDLGYVADGELPYKNENDALKTMKTGEIRVVETNSGFAILKLNNIISATDEIIDVRYITIPITETPTQREVEEKIRQIQGLIDRSTSAKEMIKNAEAINLQISPVISLTTHQIDQQLSQLLQMAQNGISKIVCTRTEVLCACILNKRRPKVHIPSKVIIKENMINDKLDLLAQHELEKAKRTIFVEHKH